MVKNTRKYTEEITTKEVRQRKYWKEICKESESTNKKITTTKKERTKKAIQSKAEHTIFVLQFGDVN